MIKPLFVSEKIWLSFPVTCTTFHHHWISDLYFPTFAEDLFPDDCTRFRNSLIGKEISTWLTKCPRRWGDSSPSSASERTEARLSDSNYWYSIPQEFQDHSRDADWQQPTTQGWTLSETSAILSSGAWPHKNTADCTTHLYFPQRSSFHESEARGNHVSSRSRPARKSSAPSHGPPQCFPNNGRALSRSMFISKSPQVVGPCV